jgi:transposase
VEHIGIDLGRAESQISILTDAGELLSERIRTERGRFMRVLGARPNARILIEASTESEWVARCLEQLGHEVIVADPNYAPMYAQRSRRVKTDRRDAEALAQACRLGAYRPAHRTSDHQRHIRAFLGVRESLVRTRVRWIVLIRSLLRREGYRVRDGQTSSFVQRVGELELPRHLKEEIAPLLALLGSLNVRIASLDRRLVEISRKDEVVKRLMTVPGVGPVIAVCFVATLDRVDRFRGPHQVESYLGLVPREWSSSEIQRRGHITKMGNTRMRWLLVEAARCVMRGKKRPESATLREWGDRIAQRRGRSIAAVAVARRLAGVLYAIWRDASVYDPGKLKSPITVTQAA